jgi:hypothetical protein
MATHAITAQQSAQQHRLLRQMKEERSSCVSREKGLSGHYLGQRLVILGKWLEAFGHAQSSF